MADVVKVEVPSPTQSAPEEKPYRQPDIRTPIASISVSAGVFGFLLFALSTGPSAWLSFSVLVWLEILVMGTALVGDLFCLVGLRPLHRWVWCLRQPRKQRENLKIEQLLKRELGRVRRGIIGDDSALLKVQTRIVGQLHKLETLREQGDFIAASVEPADPAMAKQARAIRSKLPVRIAELQVERDAVASRMARIDAFLKTLESENRLRLVRSLDLSEYGQEVSAAIGETDEIILAAQGARASASAQLTADLETLNKKILPEVNAAAAKMLASDSDLDRGLADVDRTMDAAVRLIPVASED
ncbi:MAG: hypothetical protein Q7R83_03740 [bacterium]|nr:hypothetical protein [bacterium]